MTWYVFYIIAICYYCFELETFGEKKKHLSHLSQNHQTNTRTEMTCNVTVAPEDDLNATPLNTPFALLTGEIIAK